MLAMIKQKKKMPTPYDDYNDKPRSKLDILNNLGGDIIAGLEDSIVEKELPQR
jgi:hypothetical protein